jgi:3-hydroxyacyl-CoA dehydrogenase/enoyl-CoA hydratase/3-hydroxybutyryl-CoA epimerase
MSDQSPVTHSVDADGVGWLCFDDPGGRANVLNPPVLAALRAAVAALAAQPLKAVVVHSAKEKIFIAGADLKWLAALPDAAAALQLARTGQELFAQLANFKVPVVCAIHGACAGGGYELALACHWRIATDAKETSLGLPEVGLGVIPGWGGCARLPRLIGAQAAVAHLLKAALVPAAAALTAGLVDEVVPAAELKTRAKAMALRLSAEGLPNRAVPAATPADFFAGQRQTVRSRMRGQPAPLAMLDAVEQGAALSVAAALELEANLFGGVAAGEVAKNLIHVFNLRERGKKLSLDAWFRRSRRRARRRNSRSSASSAPASWARASPSGARRAASASSCAMPTAPRPSGASPSSAASSSRPRRAAASRPPRPTR